MAVINPENKRGSSSATVGIDTVGNVPFRTAPSQYRSTCGQGNRIAGNRITGGLPGAVRGMEAVVESAVPGKVDHHGLAIQLAIGGVVIAAVNLKQVELFAVFIAAAVIRIHPYLDGGREIVVDVGVLDPECKIAAGLSVIWDDAVSLVTGLTGPGQGGRCRGTGR